MHVTAGRRFVFLSIFVWRDLALWSQTAIELLLGTSVSAPIRRVVALDDQLIFISPQLGIVANYVGTALPPIIR